MKKFIASNYKVFLLLFALLISTIRIWAADETFASGAYIIDMGQATQTVKNGLKPYGLVYTLIKDHSVPVKWAINPSKAKDGTDFSYGGVNYKGGSFIIPAEYVNAAVLAKINTWKAKGVVVVGPTTGTFVAPVYRELTSWPRAVLDEDNDDIVKGYYTSAEIPSASYVLAGNPTMLTGCDDLYVLPHADPQDWIASWKTALDNYVKNNQGYLWVACHAASALEGVAPGGAGLPFLSTSGLTLWEDHGNGSGSYTYNPAYDADPIMQFIGKLDAATTNGSERIYMPPKGTNWLNTTKVAVYQPVHADADPNEAAVLIYGPAYGNTNYGTVMYEAGHDHSGNAAANVAAMRAYFNFVLLAGIQKQINITTNIPPTIISGSTISLNAGIENGNPPYTYTWTSSCAGGSFSNPNASNTTYSAPTVTDPTTCVISVLVSDNCGRFSYSTETIVVREPENPTATDDMTTCLMNNSVDITVLSNDIEADGALVPATVTFISGTEPNPTTQGTFTVNPSTGIVTFTPVTGFYGTATIDYQVCDIYNLCDVATITVNVIVGISNLYPALGPGTLAFEDLWPGKGDYDFNDLVMDYQFEIISNLNNNIEQVNATFVIKAIGATLHNGFGFQLSEAIDPDDLTITGYELTSDYITLSSNGTEAGQSKPTIIVYDDSFDQLLHPGSGLGINTTPDAPYVTPVTLTVNITFAPDKYSYNTLDISNFNPFLIVNQTRGIEIHLPNYPPTDLVDPNYFGTVADNSIPSSGRYYLSSSNLPWAINIYESFDYPIEKADILQAHLKFGQWAESSGTLYSDWFKNLPGYRNEGLIYQVPGKK